jgi:hypothetical protein
MLSRNFVKLNQVRIELGRAERIMRVPPEF